jgi:transcription elongation factor Elf1
MPPQPMFRCPDCGHPLAVYTTVHIGAVTIRYTRCRNCGHRGKHVESVKQRQ